MARIIKPPTPLLNVDMTTAVFLAGSIEMGKAEDWQTKVQDSLNDLHYITILNPRRDDWDSSWVQSIENDKFREQVNWELYGIENANLVAMYFSPGTMSPISLLELGLRINNQQSKKIVVCCPKGYERKGNVDIVCKRHSVPQVETLDELAEFIEASILHKILDAVSYEQSQTLDNI